MKGRVQGRPTKWVSVSVEEEIPVGKPGMKFEVWEKWKQKDKKVGTLIVSVGGLRWRPNKKGKYISKSWDDLSAFFKL